MLEAAHRANAAERIQQAYAEIDADFALAPSRSGALADQLFVGLVEPLEEVCD